VTWTVAIDIGGTFTDAVADDGRGRRLTVKVPSVPRNPAAGLLDALCELRDAGVALDDVGLVFHGTTIATNAVISDDLARVVLLATKGFRDILTYRSGSRPDAYDLRQDRPKEFVPRDDRIEVEERITGQGIVLEELTVAEIERVVGEVEAREPEAVAVAFLFSYLDEDHERRVGEALSEKLPGIPISLSCDVAKEFREYPRTVTTVVNAGLRPVVGSYLLNADKEIRKLGIPGSFLVMQSNGGGVPAERAAAEAHKLLVSGPAAGVAGVVALGAACGRVNLLSLDMGGTSSDVCLIRDGVPAVSPVQMIETHPVLSPSVDIYSAGAGGGSIVDVDPSGRLHVGPRSAGAEPGPAAYGRGGTWATVTDAHVVAGTLGAETALGGRLRLDHSAALQVMSEVGAKLGVDAAIAAEGALALTSAHLEAALRRVSIDRGEDPRRFTLVAFGGAGPLHGGQLMRDLQMPEAVIPRYPGLFSAIGLLAADLRIDDAVTVLRLLDAHAVDEVSIWFEASMADLTSRLESDGIAPNQIRTLPSIDCRYQGQGYELNVPLAGPALDLDAAVADFHRLHEAIYGHSAGEPVEAVTLRVSAFGSMGALATTRGDSGGSGPRPVSSRAVKLRDMAEPVTVPVYSRDTLAVGSRLLGPVIVEQLDATTVILGGQTARVDGHGNLWIEEVKNG
jgi:N-methylhydantoinase A